MVYEYPPDSSQDFTLLLKYKGDENCYAFNGENYIEGTDFRMESRKITRGQYTVNLTVVGENVKRSGSYYIYNSGSMFSDITINPLLNLCLWFPIAVPTVYRIFGFIAYAHSIMTQVASWRPLRPIYNTLKELLKTSKTLYNNLFHSCGPRTNAEILRY